MFSLCLSLTNSLLFLSLQLTFTIQRKRKWKRPVSTPSAWVVDAFSTIPPSAPLQSMAILRFVINSLSSSFSMTRMYSSAFGIEILRADWLSHNPPTLNDLISLNYSSPWKGQKKIILDSPIWMAYFLFCVCPTHSKLYCQPPPVSL